MAMRRRLRVSATVAPARHDSCTASRPLPPPQGPLSPHTCVRRACVLACRVPERLFALLALFARHAAV